MNLKTLIFTLLVSRLLVGLEWQFRFGLEKQRCP
jgi:hypothetical protein